MILKNTQGETEKFFTRFNAPESARKSFKPVFMVINESYSGELADSYGLFEKNHILYEVHGSECSIWDFNGQWQPEPVTKDYLIHQLTVLNFGISEYDSESFNSHLSEAVNAYFKDNPIGDLVCEYLDSKTRTKDDVFILSEWMDENRSDAFDEIFSERNVVENVYKFVEPSNYGDITFFVNTSNFTVTVNMPGFNHYELMNEIVQLERSILTCIEAKMDLMSENIKPKPAY